MIIQKTPIKCEITFLYRKMEAKRRFGETISFSLSCGPISRVVTNKDDRLVCRAQPLRSFDWESGQLVEKSRIRTNDKEAGRRGNGVG